jgi:hypothetical protein
MFMRTKKRWERETSRRPVLVSQNETRPKGRHEASHAKGLDGVAVELSRGLGLSMGDGDQDGDGDGEREGVMYSPGEGGRRDDREGVTGERGTEDMMEAQVTWELTAQRSV